MRTLIILSVIFSGCTSTSITSKVYGDNKDVVILALLVQDHFKKTDNLDDNFILLLKKDTLSRISKCFDKVDIDLKGGHISVYYKFSKLRTTKLIQLSDKEKELMNRIRWKEKDYKEKYDGEIRLDYGERFYRLLRFYVQKPST